MNGVRKAVIILCLLVAASMQTITAYAQKGIVFVHGTRDHRIDAEGIYWKVDFLEQVRNQLDNPAHFLVTGCDFSQYMWHEDSAGCITDQIIGFMTEQKLDAVSVYTHSHGSNVMRFILSNPTYDPRSLKVQQAVDQLIAVAPSSEGTPLADEVL
ncbi:MAG: hypothetical protein L0H35_06325, partial [Psychrobacter sp.]|nr:hypothetical protein [Psychrobacter sp.]